MYLNVWSEDVEEVDLCPGIIRLACGEEWREEWTCVLCVADLHGKSGGLVCCVLQTCLWGRVEGGVDLCAVCCRPACGEEWREE